jgi:hypothetical protein
MLKALVIATAVTATAACYAQQAPLSAWSEQNIPRQPTNKCMERQECVGASSQPTAHGVIAGTAPTTRYGAFRSSSPVIPTSVNSA